MPPDSSDGSTPSRSSVAHLSNASNSKAAAAFDHSIYIFGDIHAKNENTFLNAVDVSEICTGASQSGHQIAGESLFEKLPLELIVQVFEQLDISSLVSIASTNLRVRGFVQGLPDLQKIQQNLYASRAISRMYTLETARLFTLKDFMKAFTSWSCNKCNNRTDFAVSFDLMSCERYCHMCYLSSRETDTLPVEMAAQLLQLDHQEIVDHVGVSHLPIPSMFQRRSCCGHLRRTGIFRLVQVTSLALAVRQAKLKYAKSGGPQHLQTTVATYLRKYNIEPPSGGLLVGGIKFPGLEKAIEAYWSLLGVVPTMPKQLILCTLPYLEPKSNPTRVEPGLWCEGCGWDRGVMHGFDLKLQRYREPREIYTKETFCRHLKTCQNALNIEEGIILPLSEEFRLIEELRLKVMEYWPRASEAPQEFQRFLHVWYSHRKWRAAVVRGCHARAMRRIIELGELDKECKRKLADSTREFSEKCDNAPISSTTSSKRVTFDFTIQCPGGPTFNSTTEPRRATTGPIRSTPRTRTKPTFRRNPDIWGTGRSESERSLIEQISAISVQDDVENLPSWRVLPKPERDEKSGTILEAGRLQARQTSKMTITPQVIHQPKERHITPSAHERSLNDKTSKASSKTRKYQPALRPPTPATKHRTAHPQTPEIKDINTVTSTLQKLVL
jgi:hypothetical protein